VSVQHDRPSDHAVARQEQTLLDGELNKAYQAFKAKIGAGNQTVLLTAQRAWLAFRDAEIRSIKANASWVDMMILRLVNERRVQLERYTRYLVQGTREKWIQDARIQYECLTLDCMTTDYAQKDIELNEAYQTILSASNRQSLLREAQRKWISWRDAEFVLFGAICNPMAGQNQTINMHLFRNQMLVARRDDIMTYSAG
ncbi:MAG TPA: lysozyme inhibitor LprI family protein, partial [Rhodothermales bacterium]|nr:lysozyme inhibitor LprI family protein [Rhodothermales bacterium]